MGYSKWSRERSEPIKESAAKEVAKMRRSKPRSGDPLEYWAAHYFGKELGFRVPESGRLGHKEVLFDPQLQGDFVNDLPWLPRRVRGDGKDGYGTPDYLTFQREWLEKIEEEATGAGDWGCVVGKLKHKHNGEPVEPRAFVVFSQLVTNLIHSAGMLYWYMERNKAFNGVGGDFHSIPPVPAAQEVVLRPKYSSKVLVGEMLHATGNSSLRIRRDFLLSVQTKAEHWNGLPFAILHWQDGRLDYLFPYATWGQVNRDIESLYNKVQERIEDKAA